MKQVTCENCSKKFDPRGLKNHQRHCAPDLTSPDPILNTIQAIEDEISELEDEISTRKRVLTYLRSKVVE